MRLSCPIAGNRSWRDEVQQVTTRCRSLYSCLALASPVWSCLCLAWLDLSMLLSACALLDRARSAARQLDRGIALLARFYGEAFAKISAPL